jgi:D-glycero-alpha-D-manno-heptose 1-phosphate guanylyltransferase
MTREAIILAGGLGSRLRSVTGSLPKPLAPVAGRPFLELLLEMLAWDGFSHVVLSLGYGADAIRERFGNGSPRLALSYVIEESPLGTGGAMREAFQHLHGARAFVVNGDTFAQPGFGAMETSLASSAATLAVALKRVENVSRNGAVLVENGLNTGFVKKGDAGAGLINAGVYLTGRDLFDGFDLPPSFSFERDFLAANLAQLQPLGFVMDGYFIDIGVPEDYARAQRELPMIMEAHRD